MKEMTKVFRPAITLMNRLKYLQKFSLISCIFVLPLSLLMYLLITEIQTRSDFAEKEMYGNAYLRPLRQLWSDIPKLQLASNDNSQQASEEVKRLQLKINNQIESLATIDKKLNAELETTDKFNTLKQAWSELQNQQDSNIDKNTAYQSIRQQVNDLKIHVGDKSNLILDPDIDSYYLMDATLLKLPEMQQALVEIQLLTQKTIQTKQDSLETRRQLIGILANLRYFNQDLKSNMTKALKYQPDSKLDVKLQESLNNFTNTVDLLADTVVPLSGNGNIVSAKVFSIAAEQNLQKSYLLWDKSIVELDILLQKRIDGFVQRQVLMCIFVLIVLSIILYLFIAFYLGVKQTVSSLNFASQQMVNGTVTETITLDTRDELAEVLQSFNNIALALIGANQEVNLLNQCLKDENLRMGAELEVTSRLQQMILPKTQELAEIQDLDIAGFMLPASEVGGDYYDIISHDGHVKIGIGDVTGHGLESGVLMIMVQTAVRTLLENNETDPKKFLDTLNRTIYQNVKRMNSDKNMTLCLLDYHDGRVRISGQHEEILIIRKGGLVQRLDTVDLGFPIGLEVDISNFIGYADVQLYPGDVIVLYTDGVTEAENSKGELYGLKQLIQIIKQNWQKSAEDIKQAVVDDLHEYMGQQKLLDDITLVILKQKQLQISSYREEVIEEQSKIYVETVEELVLS
jgi:serine phosphatase RsbU (regulator of sigma subunit)